MYVSIGMYQSSQTLSITKRGFENEFEPDPNVYLKLYFTLQSMCISNGAGNNENNNGLTRSKNITNCNYNVRNANTMEIDATRAMNIIPTVMTVACNPESRRNYKILCNFFGQITMII